jgi:type III restriction-modification system methyltransferase
MSDLKMHTANLVAKNIEKLTALFPNCITETRNEQGEITKGVDFDLLRQELSEVLVEGEQERYTLNWVGKKESILAANAPIAKTLRPCREESVNFDTTENLFIEGDNLDALKLLQENYLGKVKMIYIDPPYNTGKDFIYSDNFAENIEEFLIRSNQVDEENNRLVSNLESNGRFHSDWLSMIYSRLRLARNLLRDDGVIFISIDDNEQANLKRICDEIFSESNFVSSLIWSLGTGTQAGHFTRAHETILVYFKDKKLVPNFSGGEGIIEHSALKKISAKNPESEFFFPKGTRWDAPDDFELSGTWGGSEKTTLLSGRMICKNNKLAEDVVLSAGWAQKNQMKSWFSGEDTIDSKGQKVISFYFNKNGVLRYEKERSVINPPTILQNIANTQNGSDEILQLFQSKVFDYPKPTKLLEFLLNLLTDNDDLILDFFSGSGSIAHSVMNLNLKDGKKRRFICVQIAEDLTEALKAASAENKVTLQNAIEFLSKNQKPLFVSEITKERIRRAGSQILQNLDENKSLDVGFRVLKIDSSNMKDIYYQPEQYDKTMLDHMVSHIKEDRSAEDLLFQVMLDWGIELSLPIERKTIDGSEVYFVAGNTLVACFDKFTMNVVDEIAKVKPLRVVSTELAIVHDQDKTNIKERFKQLSSDTEVKFL